jgi:hypothetical protein
VKKRSMIGEKEEAKMVVRGRKRCRTYKGTWYICILMCIESMYEHSHFISN